MDENNEVLMNEVEEQYHELLAAAIEGFMQDTGRAPNIEDMERALQCSLPHINENGAPLHDWWYVSELLHCVELFRSVRGSDMDTFEPILSEVFENILKITGTEPSDELIESLMSFGLEEFSDSEEDDDVFSSSFRSDRSESVDSVDLQSSDVDVLEKEDEMWEKLGKSFVENLFESGERITSSEEAAIKVYPPLINYLGEMYGMRATVPSNVFTDVIVKTTNINPYEMKDMLKTLTMWLKREFKSGDVDVRKFGDELCSRYDISNELHRKTKQEDGQDFSLSGKWIAKRKRAMQRVASPHAARIMWVRLLSRVKRAQRNSGAEDMNISEFIKRIFNNEKRMTATIFFEKMGSIGIDLNTMGTDVHILVASLGGGDGMDTQTVVDIDVLCDNLLMCEKEMQNQHNNDNSTVNHIGQKDDSGKVDSIDTDASNTTTKDTMQSRPAASQTSMGEEKQAKMWHLLGSFVADAMQKTGQAGTLPEAFIKTIFPSTQVGRTDFLAGLNSIGVNREGMGEHFETLLFLTGFSDLSSSNLIDVSVLVQIIEENYDFSVLNLSATRANTEVGDDSALLNFDFRIHPDDRKIAISAKIERMWVKVRAALFHANISGALAEGNGIAKPLAGAVRSLFRGEQFIAVEEFKSILEKVGISEAILGPDWHLLVNSMQGNRGQRVNIHEFIKKLIPYGSSEPVSRSEEQQDSMVLEPRIHDAKADDNQTNGNPIYSRTQPSTTTSTPEKLTEADIRMINRVGAQLICAMKPRPGQRYHNGLEDFLHEQVFAKETHLSSSRFLVAVQKFGVTKQYLGADWDRFIKFAGSSDGSNFVHTNRFRKNLLSNFDCQHGIRAYEESLKVMHDRLSACLVSCVPSIKKLDFASPTEQMEEIANVLRETLYVDEISGSVGAITVEDFLKRMKTVGVHQDTMGYCMDTVLALVDPCQTGRMDIDLFVEEVVAHFDSMAWFTEWKPEAPDVNAAIRSGASIGQRIIRSEYSVRQSVESPLQEKEASHRVEGLHEHPTNISPEGRIELARQLSRCLVESLINQSKQKRYGNTNTKFDPLQLNKEEILPMIWKAFELFDADHTGLIDMDEFIVVMKHLGISEKSMGASMKTLVDLVDEDGDGLIDYDEFMQFVMTYFDRSAWLIYNENLGDMENSIMLSKREMVQRISKLVAMRIESSSINLEDGRMPSDVLTHHLEEVFKSFDVDKSGSLSAEEFWKALKKFDNETIHLDPHVMSAIDTDSSGSIDYREFVSFMSLYFDSSVLTSYKNIALVNVLPALEQQQFTIKDTTLETAPNPLLQSLKEIQSQELKSLLDLERQLGIAQYDPVARNDAAIKLQSQFRRRHAKKRVDLLVEQKKTNAAARKIQARQRGISIRAKHHEKMASRNEAAATRLQAGFRGYKTRRRVTKQRNESNLAATKLQAGFRGHKARRKLKKQERKSHNAATKLQAGFRGHVARRHANQRRDTVNAATKLQAGFRGHAARRMYKKERTEQNDAAVKLQARFRGFKARTRITTEDTGDRYRVNLEPDSKAKKPNSEMQKSHKSEDDYAHAASILSPSSPAELSEPDSSKTPIIDSIRVDNHFDKRQPQSGDSRTEAKKKRRKKRKKHKRKNANRNRISNRDPFNQTKSPQSPTSTLGSSLKSKGRASPRSLYMSLANGQTLANTDTFSPSTQNRLLQTSLQLPIIDWGEVRLVKLDVTRAAHSLESLYRPLAMPHLLPEAFEKLVTKIKVLWRQLHFPEAQRGPLTARIQIVNRENYTLLVSHMLLLQSAHTQLVSIINKIRLELGEDPVGVGTGAHVSPSGESRSLKRAERPAGSMPHLFGGSPRRARLKMRHRRRVTSPKRNDQWTAELSVAVAQFKAVTPWLRDFVYKGVRYG